MRWMTWRAISVTGTTAGGGWMPTRVMRQGVYAASAEAGGSSRTRTQPTLHRLLLLFRAYVCAYIVNVCVFIVNEVILRSRFKRLFSSHAPIWIRVFVLNDHAARLRRTCACRRVSTAW